MVLGAILVFRGAAAGMALRAFHRSGSRLDRFKLADRGAIRETLLADSEVTKAVRLHASETGASIRDTRKRVESYIDEIVPFFNILTYYKIGLFVSRIVLNLFYKVSAEYASN